MKNIMIRTAVLFALTAAAGCEKQEITSFDKDIHAINFELKENQDDPELYEFSFTSHLGEDDAVAEIGLFITGMPADYDREVKAEVVTEKTSARPDYYELLGGTVKAGEMAGTYRLRIRNHPELLSQYDTVTLRLVPTADFEVGVKENSRVTFRWSDQVVKPACWFIMSLMVMPVFSPNAMKALMAATGQTEFYYGQIVDGKARYDMNIINGTYKLMLQLYLEKYKQEHGSPLLHDDPSDPVHYGTEVKTV